MLNFLNIFFVKKIKLKKNIYNIKKTISLKNKVVKFLKFNK